MSIKKKEREILIFMENVQNEENPSLTKFYDELVFSSEDVLEANTSRMVPAQLIEFYEYCLERAGIVNNNCEMYWYASSLLEESPIIIMYNKSKLDEDVTFGNNDGSYMDKLVVTEQDLIEINDVVSILEQRKKDKKNPIKKLVKYFKG